MTSTTLLPKWNNTNLEIHREQDHQEEGLSTNSLLSSQKVTLITLKAARSNKEIMSVPAEKMEEGSLPPVQAHAVSGVTAVQPMGVSTGVPMHQQEKVGSKCCGCCCDFRRAVIVISVLFICFTVIALIINVTAAATPTFNNINDDQVEAIIEKNTTRSIIISAISLVMAIVGLLGARFFNIPMLATVIVWYVIDYGLSVWIQIDNINQINNVDTVTTVYRYPIGWIIVEAIVTALWIYPHAGLIAEIQKGIMSRETYPREEFSCCCIDKRTRQW